MTTRHKLLRSRAQLQGLWLGLAATALGVASGFVASLRPDAAICMVITAISLVLGALHPWRKIHRSLQWICLLIAFCTTGYAFGEYMIASALFAYLCLASAFFLCLHVLSSSTAKIIKHPSHKIQPEQELQNSAFHRTVSYSLCLLITWCFALHVDVIAIDLWGKVAAAHAAILGMIIGRPLWPFLLRFRPRRARLLMAVLVGLHLAYLLLLAIPGDGALLWPVGTTVCFMMGIWQPIMMQTASHRPTSPQGKQLPERYFIGTFFLLCTLGGILLSLPQANQGSGSLHLIDSLFMATSAVCVTGLSLFDISSVLSGFGQAVLLLLIQLGGLGIMTFSTTALFLLGKRPSMRLEGTLAQWLGGGRRTMIDAAQQVLLVTFVLEGLGACLLWIQLLALGKPLLPGLWESVFLAISAFCNAGFALDPKSLVSYQQTPGILYTVSCLIICGGLSPAALLSLRFVPRRTRHQMAAEHQVALLGTLLLLGLGTVLCLISEWSHQLQHLHGWDKLHNAWFQSVTLRTAGFNSIAIENLAPLTSWWMMLWMYIGGGPGGTAGGVKITTIAVLIATLYASLAQRQEVHMLAKRIALHTIFRAIGIVTISLLWLFAVIALLLLLETHPPQALIFEAVSALGTVGLSMGITNQLNMIGKLLIIMTMFIGRIGGYSLLLLIMQAPWYRVGLRPQQEFAVG